jgi:hypothetical protein
MPAFIFLAILLAILMGGAMWLDTHPGSVQLLLFSGYIGIAVYIYRKFSNSDWHRDYRRQQTLDRERREQARALAKLTKAQNQRAAEWDAFTMPTGTDFIHDTVCPNYPAVHTAHAALTMTCINHPNFTRIRANYDVKQYQQHYIFMVSATNRALEAYANALSAPYRRIPVETPFTYQYLATEEDLQPANTALANEFRGSYDDLFHPGLLRPLAPINRPTEPDKPSQPSWMEDKDFNKELREYKDRMRQYEKALKVFDQSEQELWESQTLTQQTFWNTPLYYVSDYFMPEPLTLPFVVPVPERFAGTWIIAPSGQGKTNLMWHLIDADRKRRGTVVIMDSKGTLLNSYRGYPDAVLIDARTTRINPFQIGHGDQAIDFIEYIFSLIAVSMTQKQQSLFYPVLRLVTKVPNGSLDTFKKILILGWRALDLGKYIEACDPNTRDFFTLGSPPAFDSPTYKESKQELIWRFDLFLSKPAMQQIFSASESNVDFIKLLDSRKTILINNNVNDLGENGAEFFGRFFLALTWMGAIRRTDIPDKDKVPVHFYIDEAQTVIAKDAKVPVILDECRSQMIALTIAHQRINRITSAEVLDALFNCPVRFANADNDAASIANRFGLSAEELKLHAHKFACYVRYSDGKRKMDKAVILDVPFFDMTQFPPPPAKTAPEPPQPAPESPRAVPTDEVEDF